MEKEIIKDLEQWLLDHQEEMFRDIGELVAIPTVVEKGEGGYPYGTALAKAIIKMSQLQISTALSGKIISGTVSVSVMEKGLNSLAYGAIWMWFRRETGGFMSLFPAER